MSLNCTHDIALAHSYHESTSSSTVLCPEKKGARSRSQPPSAEWFAPAVIMASVAWREGRHCLSDPLVWEVEDVPESRPLVSQGGESKVWFVLRMMAKSALIDASAMLL